MTTTPDTTQARTLFTTNQAAHIILGGTDSEAYWDITFEEFVAKLQAGMVKHIGNPGDAPWRRLIDYTPQDYLDLTSLIESMDFVKDPADHMDQPMARAFARRCDIVGMHGGINGIGVGKDTAANSLKSHGFVSMSFADTLKASLCMAYGLPLRFVTERSLKEAPLPGTKFTPRRLMQLWGTEVGRGIEPGLWLKRHQLRIASAMFDMPAIAKRNSANISATNGIRVSVPDVRFADEASYVREHGGFVAWISRPSLVAVAAQLSNGHSSEAGIPTHPTDLHLVNDSPMAVFQQQASSAILQRFHPSEAAAARRTNRP